MTSTDRAASPATTPVVSVVVPTHNRAKLLRRAVTSVLNQTLRELELIVVDDCSTDDTPAVLASITDPRLRVIRREVNGRAATARNDGIRAARGEFIAFQDDDDVWMPHKLARQVQAMRAAPADVGLCLGGDLRWHPKYSIYIGGPAHFDILDFRGGMTMAFDYGLIATPGWLVRKAALDDVGIFDTRMRTWDDLELAMRIERRWKLIHVDEPLFLQDHVLGSGLMNQLFNFSHDLQVLMDVQGDRWRDRRDISAIHCYNVGRLELQYGDAAIARRWFAQALEARRSNVRAAAFWLASFLPQAWIRSSTAWLRSLFHQQVWWLVEDPAVAAGGSGRRA